MAAYYKTPYPASTYRIQLQKAFTLRDLERIIPYLDQLGVGAIYASPLLTAVPGSAHGYDGLNPHQINPEIGSEEDLFRCHRLLEARGMLWIQDIVPNHMAFHPDSPWLRDVLAKGQMSPYAAYFDIDWAHPACSGKLMAPFLPGSLPDAIEQRHLRLGYENGAYVLYLNELAYPLREETQEELRKRGRQQDLFAEQTIPMFQGDKSLIREIAENQHYRLCPWQSAAYEINYRRFFTINGLICLNMQHDVVFRDYHAYIRQLVHAGVIQGLRIDHIDGLSDPAGYLSRLQDFVGIPIYTVVEKILQADEALPAQWPTEGATGYEFLATVNQLLTYAPSESAFADVHASLVQPGWDIAQETRKTKEFILHQHMAGELDNLYRLTCDTDQEARNLPKLIVRDTIAAILVYCPVYRFYGRMYPLAGDAAAAVYDLLHQIRQDVPELRPGVDCFERMWLNQQDEKYLALFQRFMQFSGPLMAKGLEDTLMYTHSRWIGHNEVGDRLDQFGMSPAGFHHWMKNRQERWPLSLSATSTHDTKRGEDARARLQALSAMPAQWTTHAPNWVRLMQNSEPDTPLNATDCYFILQVLVANHPPTGSSDDDFPNRIDSYIEKFLREGKVNSNWVKPNEPYEAAMKRAVRQFMAVVPQAPAWRDLLEKLEANGFVNSLAQLVLKMTCPGIPDVYQGAELWDFSLVDPDNRRPVDYAAREQALEDPMPLAIADAAGLAKLHMTHQLLLLRRAHAALFAEGLYHPLKTAGAYKDHVLAYARRMDRTWVIVAAPLHIGVLTEAQRCEPGQVDWKDTKILLPDHAPTAGSLALDLESAPIAAPDRQFFVSHLWSAMPVSVLILRHANNERSAGVLLPIASLANEYAIGDFGPAAHAFVRFLSQSQQRYWQILPLNPTETEAGNSPYSSYSSMAGNPLLISMDLLVAGGLLRADDVRADARRAFPNAVDYDAAAAEKDRWLRLAFARFVSGDFPAMQLGFARYAAQQAYWLDDVSLYAALKKHFVREPWFRWPKAFQQRDKDALEKFRDSHQEEILFYQWLQFIAETQWRDLRRYATAAGVRLFGDMPFYVSYDSADVWAHQHLFCLDATGALTGVAGVPPDYFSEDGQLWGMPTYNWSAMRDNQYDWWIKRLQRNLAFFDLLRIDHFRAFQDYWQVPANASNARGGQWLPGPRDEFFTTVQNCLGPLPIVAEDLGDKMEAVYALRQRWRLPGMKVLQFAWGPNMPQSVDAPHHHEVNSIVYTGTHDNNTTIGWYSEETNNADHERMHQYLGLSIRAANIHVILTRLAYASVAKTSIIPIQDLLGLDATSRMNTPGKGAGNWKWRMQAHYLSEALSAQLRHWAQLFDRV